MRDPDRIRRVMFLITQFWVAHPDWRLGQLLINAAKEEGWTDPDLFNLEDTQLEKGLIALIEAYTKGKYPSDEELDKFFDNAFKGLGVDNPYADK